MDTKTITIRLDVEAHAAFKIASFRAKKSLNDVVSEMIAAWTANPDLLSDAAVGAAESERAANFAASLSESERRHFEMLGHTPETFKLQQEIAAGEKLGAQLDSELGWGPTTAASCTEVDARIAKRQATEQEQTSDELESPEPPDGSVDGIY